MKKTYSEYREIKTEMNESNKMIRYIEKYKKSNLTWLLQYHKDRVISCAQLLQNRYDIEPMNLCKVEINFNLN